MSYVINYYYITILRIINYCVIIIVALAIHDWAIQETSSYKTNHFSQIVYDKVYSAPLPRRPASWDIKSHSLRRHARWNCLAPCGVLYRVSREVRTDFILLCRWTSDTHNPCGGGLEYLYRSLASRRRRWKGSPVSRGITGLPCSWRIYNGDLALEAGGVSNYTVYGHESRRTRTREWLCWRGPAAIVNDRLVLSSEKVLHKNDDHKDSAENRKSLVVKLK
jgi:hypothetical protein